MSIDRGTLAVLAVGLALVAGGVQYGHYIDQPPTHYYVESATAADARNAANSTYEPHPQVVYDYENLSDTAQRVFRAALDDPDGRVSYRGSEYVAPEFTYLSDTTGSPGVGNYHVRFEGDYYYLRAHGRGMNFGFGTLKAGAAVLAGLGATAVGARRARDTRVRVGALASVLALAATALGQFGWFGVHGFYALAALGVVVAFGAAAGGWLATDRLAD